MSFPVSQRTPTSPNCARHALKPLLQQRVRISASLLHDEPDVWNKWRFGQEASQKSLFLTFPMMSLWAGLLFRVSVSPSNNTRSLRQECVFLHCLKRAGFLLAGTHIMTHCRFLRYYRLAAFATESVQNVPCFIYNVSAYSQETLWFEQPCEGKGMKALPFEEGTVLYSVSQTWLCIL